MAKEKGHILIIDDDTDVLTAASLLLKQHFTEIVTSTTPEAIPVLFEKKFPDVIVLDMNFKSAVNNGNEGFFWLNKILSLEPTAVVIMFTAFGDIELAVRAVKEGAFDFTLKPWENEKFISTISKALKYKLTKAMSTDIKQNKTILEKSAALPKIIGDSSAMHTIFKIIDKVAITDADLLILGENGTGKDVIARLLHQKSKRKNESFVTVDLGAISASLFESELFGHKKGAFTDAKEDRKGRFERANGGTLFLDEIGNLTLAQQAKLLSALQNREIYPVGASIPVKIDVRLICATNANLQEMVDRKEFRQDLYFRIKTFEISLPPLRERQEDIDLLSEHFLSLYNTKYKKDIRHIDKSALLKLRKFPWPGNVRELQHCIERAVIMCDHETLTVSDLMLQDTNTENVHENTPLTNRNLDEIEKATIEKVLKDHKGNISNAAKELGLTRAALYRRIEKHGI